MSDEKHENFDDIAWEVRAQWQGCEDCSLGELDRKDILALVARLDAAHKREVETLNSVIQAECASHCAERERLRRAGNVAKMREAVENISEYADCAAMRQNDAHTQHYIEQIRQWAQAALAAPPRNCDIPLVVDGPADNNADKAWLVFKRHNADAYFDVSGLLRCIDWLFALATEKEGGVK